MVILWGRGNKNPPLPGKLPIVQLWAPFNKGNFDDVTFSFFSTVAFLKTIFFI